MGGQVLDEAAQILDLVWSKSVLNGEDLYQLSHLMHEGKYTSLVLNLPYPSRQEVFARSFSGVLFDAIRPPLMNALVDRLESCVTQNDQKNANLVIEQIWGLASKPIQGSIGHITQDDVMYRNTPFKGPGYAKIVDQFSSAHNLR